MIHGSKELERKLEALEGIADQHMERLVRNQITRIQAEAKRLCPVEGEELRDSIRTMVERDGDVIVGAAYTNKAYAGYVEIADGALRFCDRGFYVMNGIVAELLNLLPADSGAMDR